ncbi:YeeE/YedE family protein [Aspergillus lucknowensis]|uniref:YeeE/YedE family integral membrane protein n=1 Tax=Aspergillus lucknowensis TaxID=176173 RepID=A0ABR4M0C6_9EURO
MFTPVHTSLGALLLYQGSSGLLLHNGAVFGISSLLAGSVLSPNQDNIPIIAGLLSGVVPIYLFMPSLLPVYPAAPDSWATLLSTVGTGFLLGWGTKRGRGCTSGHMLCGISRLSPRSLIATGIFFTTAVLTANIFSRIPPCPAGIPCYTPTYPSKVELVFMVGATAATFLTNCFFVPRVMNRSERSRTIFSYLAGFEFGIGLLISGMADPLKVLRFFAFVTDYTRFDPSLGLVILFALVPSIVTYLAMQPGQGSCPKIGQPAAKPTLANSWRLPTATVADINRQFVLGAMVFGVVWGLNGVCPGPAALRSVLQPVWGLAGMSGYMLGAWV